VAIIGEAPGAQESILEEPFVGPAGKWLSYGISKAGYKRSATWLTNTISCRPPENEIMCAEAIEAKKACKKGFEAELKRLKSEGVRVLVPVGNTALKALGIKEKITKARGSVYTYDGFFVVPTYHPSYIMRGGEKEEGTWLSDLQKAYEIAQKPHWKPPKEDFLLFPKLADLKKIDKELMKNKPLLAVDIETWQKSIFCIGIGLSEEKAVVVPVYRKGGHLYWDNKEWKQVKALLKRWFSSCPLMFQHSLFDLGYLRAEGFIGEEFHMGHDILLLHHAIHPEIFHNLAYIVSIYGDTPFWKDISFKNIASIDDKELRTYNARDCVVLFQVLQPMLEDLKEFQLEKTYYGVSLPLVKPVLAMTERGIKVSQYRLTKWKKQMEEEITKLEESMRTAGDLPECFKFSSGDHLRRVLYDEIAPQFHKAKKELQEYEQPGTKKKKNTKKYRELMDRYTIGYATKALYQTKATRRKTDSGLFSTNKEAIIAIEVAGKKRLADIEGLTRRTAKHDREAVEIRNLLEFSKSYRQWAILVKLISTYTSFPLDKNSRVHASFYIHGTATGRLSSKEPNMQNIPPSAKRIFVPEKDHIFIEADYSNLELRILAYLCDDWPSIEVFESGGNIHDENTKALFGLTPKDPMWKTARSATKIYRFGRNYGGGLYGIYTQVMEKVPDLELSFEKFKEIDATYEALHPNYKRWYYDTIRKVRDTRVLKNPFGRQRIFLGQDYEIEKEGVNFPNQSGAADIINPATVAIWERLKVLDAYLVVQVYDSLLVEARKTDKKKVMAIMKEEMEKPVTIGTHTAVFPIDFKIGTSWGELKEQ
jgi:uracil-DNA glycosylase family 4